MTAIHSVTLEMPDPTAAAGFYGAAFGLRSRLDMRACDAPTSGFRAFTVSLVVSQPSTADELIGTAVDAGATPLKPAKKSLWGYGGTVQAPDGAIWKVATSSKKNTGPPTREIDDVVLLLGVEDVRASKQFYVDRGLTVARSFARAYVEFATDGIKLGLYKRRALAKDAGVLPGRHRIAPDRDRLRPQAVHRPRRVHVGTRTPSGPHTTRANRSGTEKRGHEPCLANHEGGHDVPVDHQTALSRRDELLRHAAAYRVSHHGRTATLSTPMRRAPLKLRRKFLPKSA